VVGNLPKTPSTLDCTSIAVNNILVSLDNTSKAHTPVPPGTTYSIGVTTFDKTQSDKKTAKFELINNDHTIDI
jgi:hypothetical protein